MRLEEMWGIYGLREDVISYGSGLREDALSCGSGLREGVLSCGSGLREDVLSYSSGLREYVLSYGSGLREDVLSYGSGLREDQWHVLSYETLASMDLVRTGFRFVSYYVNYGRKSERRNEGIKQEIRNKKDTNKE
jgi:DNA primase catalytic subunit